MTLCRTLEQKPEGNSADEHLYLMKTMLNNAILLHVLCIPLLCTARVLVTTSDTSNHLTPSQEANPPNHAYTPPATYHLLPSHFTKPKNDQYDCQGMCLTCEVVQETGEVWYCTSCSSGYHLIGQWCYREDPDTTQRSAFPMGSLFFIPCILAACLARRRQTDEYPPDYQPVSSSDEDEHRHQILQATIENEETQNTQTATTSPPRGISVTDAVVVVGPTGNVDVGFEDKTGEKTE